jgi:acetyltransferase-like isoleucine patch superfamily enzyme
MVNPITRIMGYSNLLWKLNITGTLRINLKMFPFKEALRLPIFIYGPIKFANLNGKIIINGHLSRGMIKIGSTDENIIHTNEPVRLFLSGTLIFNGPCRFSRGVQLLVWDKAVLEFGGNCWIGSFTKIVSFRRIEIMDEFLGSWECQIFDTDFHFIKNNLTGEVSDNTAPVKIGKKVWLGSRVNVLKGTQLPDKCIVAAGSLCNKDYQVYGVEGIILGGSPAKLIKKDVEYVSDKRLEMNLLSSFRDQNN